MRSRTLFSRPPWRIKEVWTRRSPPRDGTGITTQSRCSSLGIGVVQMARNAFDEAISSFHDASRLEPERAMYYQWAGIASMLQNRVHEALRSFEQAIAVKPDYADAHLGRGSALLAMGDLAAGWREYEWRTRHRDFTIRYRPRPVWDGSPLGGRTILIHSDQGLGDALQFIRYAPLVKERGGKVILECQSSLVRILESCPGIDGVVGLGSPLPFHEVDALLFSLPTILRTAAIPVNVPYLTANDALIGRWRNEMRADSGLPYWHRMARKRATSP